jgi:hypothetical protein
MGKQYTDDDVATALAFLEASGYPDKKGALEMASRHTRVPTRTLRRWYIGQMHPISDNTVARKKVDLAEALDNELAEIFAARTDARDEASYKDLATAAGIFIDKKQLLTGKPTQRISTVQEELAETPEDERDAVIAEAEAIIRSGFVGSSGSQTPD